ncbi:MAG: hypothetical protein MHM6MM_006570 [Cercozoa sp. M6MM]
MSFVLPVENTEIEATGRCFFDSLVADASLSLLKSSASASKDGTSASSKNDDDVEIVIDEECDINDSYALLGIPHVRFRASEALIKRAYRKASLALHPDRQIAQGREPKESEQRFKALQSAFEALSNPHRKLLHDSKIPFDEPVPEKDSADFFGTFGDAFRQWSEYCSESALSAASVSEVPSLGGDEDVPSEDDLRARLVEDEALLFDETRAKKLDAEWFEKVDQFYDFWFTHFRSWRDFTFKGEHEMEENATRDERRWVEKQNRAEARKWKKNESQRVQLLVRRANKADPRLVRRRAIWQARKEAQKAQKEAEKQARLEEEQAKKEREQKEQAQKELAAKKARQAEKRELRLAKKTLKKFAPAFRETHADLAAEACLSADGIETLLQQATLEQLRELVAVDGMERFEKLKTVHDAIAARLQQEKEKADQLRRQKAREQRGAPWSADELRRLSAALQKFPGGTTDRWERVCAFLGRVCCLFQCQRLPCLVDKLVSRAEQTR